MATSVNIGLDLPARGSNVGVWDTPVNSDFSIIDQGFGGVTTIALTSVAVTLATSQAQNNVIRFTGTLGGNVAVTLASIYKFWTIDNQILNAPSSYCVTLVSTSGTSIIGVPQGAQDVFYDGTTVKYRNLGKIGEYWDYAGSTVPSWVTAASSARPYLNCDGTAFSSAAYPQLANLLGTTTLPDSRGRFRAVLNQTTSRLTSTYGVDGDTFLASGSSQSVTLGTSNLPPYTPAGTVSNTIGAGSAGNNATPLTMKRLWTNGTTGPAQYGGSGNGGDFGNADITVTSTFVGSAQGGTSFAFSKVPPAYVGGITMIRTGI